MSESKSKSSGINVLRSEGYRMWEVAKNILYNSVSSSLHRTAQLSDGPIRVFVWETVHQLASWNNVSASRVEKEKRGPRKALWDYNKVKAREHRPLLTDRPNLEVWGRNIFWDKEQMKASWRRAWNPSRTQRLWWWEILQNHFNL